MQYRDQILTYFFIKSVFYDLLALRRLLGRVVGGILAVVCVVVWAFSHPSDEFHPHRPFWMMTDSEILQTHQEHPRYREYADYVREHHLLDQPIQQPVQQAVWQRIWQVGSPMPAPKPVKLATAELSHDDLLSLLLIVGDALDRAAPERGKPVARGSIHTEAWFEQTEALQRRLTIAYHAMQ